MTIYILYRINKGRWLHLRINNLSLCLYGEYHHGEAIEIFDGSLPIIDLSLFEMIYNQINNLGGKHVGISGMEISNNKLCDSIDSAIDLVDKFENIVMNRIQHFINR